VLFSNDYNNYPKGINDFTRTQPLSIKRKTQKIAGFFFDYSGISYFKACRQTKDRPNAVFIWIPKTAGTSICALLDTPKLKTPRLVTFRFANRGTVSFGHMDYHQLIEKKYVSRSFDKSAYKFAFSRNPYARAVSLYSYIKEKRKRLPANESFLAFCRQLKEKGCPSVGLYNVKGLSQCNPQVRWIENIKMDFVGKVENLSNDINVIFKKLKLPNNAIPKLNTSNYGNFRAHYCRESKKIVEEFYKEDFQAFDYALDDFL
jgi:hypothetical protein